MTTSADRMAFVVPVGAAYGVPIGRGVFGLCRVIGPARPKDCAAIFLGAKEAARAVMVLATRWTGTRAQLARALADPRVKLPLLLTHHGQRNKPYVIVVHEPPPRSFLRVGELAPSPADAKLKNAYYAWSTLATQYRAQLAWETDEAGVRANDKAQAKARGAREPSKPTPATTPRPGKVVSLATLARRTWFGDWREPLRSRARTRIAKLIATLRARDRSGTRDLRAIVASARSFNREREIGTLEAEALDEALHAIALAVKIDSDTYSEAIDEARDW